MKQIVNVIVISRCYWLAFLMVFYTMDNYALKMNHYNTSVSDITPAADIISFLEYEFVDDSLNVIVDNGQQFSEIHENLNKLKRYNDGGLRGKGNPLTVSISHIGDSHIQAGLLTNVVRELLQAKFGSAGRGLVVPLRLLGSNEPSDYRITSNIKRWNSVKCMSKKPAFEIGVGGIALCPTSRRGELELEISTLTLPENNEFDRIKIFHHPESPLLVEEDLLSFDMVCEDTIPNFVTDITLNALVSSVRLKADLGDSQYTTPIIYGFSLTNGCNGVLYNSVGVNGAAYPDYTSSADFFSQLRELKSDIVIVSMGTNEAVGGSRFSSEQFRGMVSGFVDSLRNSNPKSFIILTTPVGNYRKHRGELVNNPNIRLVGQEIVGYAKENHIAYWDLWSVLGGDKSADNMHNANLFANDGIHFNSDGYRLQGELLYKALINFFLQKDNLNRL